MGEDWFDVAIRVPGVQTDRVREARVGADERAHSGVRFVVVPAGEDRTDAGCDRAFQRTGGVVEVGEVTVGVEHG